MCYNLNLGSAMMGGKEASLIFIREQEIVAKKKDKLNRTEVSVELKCAKYTNIQYIFTSFLHFPPAREIKVFFSLLNEGVDIMTTRSLASERSFS